MTGNVSDRFSKYLKASSAPTGTPTSPPNTAIPIRPKFCLTRTIRRLLVVNAGFPLRRRTRDRQSKSERTTGCKATRPKAAPPAEYANTHQGFNPAATAVEGMTMNLMKLNNIQPTASKNVDHSILRTKESR